MVTCIIIATEKFSITWLVPCFHLATVALSFNESIHKVNESDGIVQLSIVLSKSLPTEFILKVKVDDNSSNAASKSCMYFMHAF